MLQAFKTLLIVAVLSAVAYGVYMALTGVRDVEPPPGATTDFQGAPQIELPTFDAPPSTSLPPMNAAAPPSSAPLVVQPESQPAAVESPRYPVPVYPDAGAAPPFVAPGVGPSDPSSLPTAAAPMGMPDATALPDPSGAGLPSESYSSAPPAVSGLDAAPTGVAPPRADEIPAADFATEYAAAQTLLQENHLEPALQLLSRWYDSPQLNEQDQQTLLLLLNQLAGTVIYSREHLLLPAYEVQPGDTLDRVAQRYQVPWELLAKINGIPDPQQLRPGDKLKVVQGPFDAVINLRTQRLTLYLGGRFAGCFPIGIGSDNTAPLGQFNVKMKTPDPKYYGPDGVIEPGDPNNPLGKYWIGLDEHIGIHGTNDPQTIGRAEARGCIRLSPRDIEDVYDMLTAESRVHIYR